MDDDVRLRSWPTSRDGQHTGEDLLGLGRSRQELVERRERHAIL